MLLTRTRLPPGGWVYDQLDAAGNLLRKFKSMSAFGDVAREILIFRQSNGLARATIEDVNYDLDKFQCDRLGWDSQWCQVQKKTVEFRPKTLFRASVHHVLDAVEQIGKLANGPGVIMDWLGAGGKPVASELAQARADRCTGRTSGIPCPFNRKGFKPTEAAAEWLKDQLEKKAQMKLTVEGEEQLLTCDRCWCHLPLKVHTPIEHIRDGTPDAMLKKMRDAMPDCWQVAEIDELNAKTTKPTNTDEPTPSPVAVLREG